MWIFLWIVLSAILLGTTGWSLVILLRQKKAWEAYAKSKNFTFTRGTYMGPAEMSGVINDYKVSFFSVERQSNDMRTRRYMTALEIELTEPVVDAAAMGTKEMLSFMQSIATLKPTKIESPHWDESLFAFMRNEESVKAYLTPERIEAYATILKTRGADILIVFNEKKLVARLETVDPMMDAGKIDKAVVRLLGLLEKVRLTPEQRAQYAAVQPAI